MPTLNKDEAQAGESKSASKIQASDDLTTLPLPEVETTLGFSPDGLTQSEAEKRLIQYGPNKIPEKTISHLDRPHIQTLMYLKLSVAGHLTIFLTRTRGPFWSFRPAEILWVAVLGTQVIATLIAIFGFGLVTPLAWYWALLVWGYALAWFIVNDRVKLLTYRVLDGIKAEKKPAADEAPQRAGKSLSTPAAPTDILSEVEPNPGGPASRNLAIKDPRAAGHIVAEPISDAETPSRPASEGPAPSTCLTPRWRSAALPIATLQGSE